MSDRRMVAPPPEIIFGLGPSGDRKASMRVLAAQESHKHSGGKKFHPMMTGFRMIEADKTQRWPIKSEQRHAIVERLIAIIEDSDTINRDRVSAAKTLSALDAQNQRAERTGVQNHERNRYLEVADRLGIDRADLV